MELPSNALTMLGYTRRSGIINGTFSWVTGYRSIGNRTTIGTSTIAKWGIG
jgi:hypothetical protein